MPKLPKIASLLFLCGILKKKWVMKLIFCMHMSITAYFKLIPWFWWGWSSISNVFKITSLQCLYDISKKKLQMKLSESGFDSTKTKITNFNKIWICLHSSKPLQQMKFSNQNTIIKVASWFTSSNIYVNWSHVRVKRKFLMILGVVFYTASKVSHDLGSGFLCSTPPIWWEIKCHRPRPAYLQSSVSLLLLLFVSVDLV